MLGRIILLSSLVLTLSAQAANFTFAPQGEKVSFQFHSDTLPDGLVAKAQLSLTNLDGSQGLESIPAHRIRFTQLNNRNGRAMIEQVMEVTLKGNKEPSCRVIFANNDVAFKAYQSLINELQVKKATRIHCVGTADAQGTIEVELGCRSAACSKNSLSITGL